MVVASADGNDIRHPLFQDQECSAGLEPWPASGCQAYRAGQRHAQEGRALFGHLIRRPHGDAWVYTNPEPLVFVRHRVDIEHIDQDIGGSRRRSRRRAPRS